MTSINNKFSDARLTHISGWLTLKDAANAARICKRWNQTMSPEQSLSQRGIVPKLKDYGDEEMRKLQSVLEKINDKITKASVSASMFTANKTSSRFPNLTHLEIPYYDLQLNTSVLDSLPHLQSLSLTQISTEDDVSIFTTRDFLKYSLSLEIQFDPNTRQIDPEFVKHLKTCSTVTALTLHKLHLGSRELFLRFGNDLAAVPKITKLCPVLTDEDMKNRFIGYFNQKRPITHLHFYDLNRYDFDKLNVSIASTLTHLSLDFVQLDGIFIKHLVKFRFLRVVLLKCRKIFDSKNALKSREASCTHLETLSIVSSNADEPITEWPSAKAIYEFIQGFPVLSHLDTDTSVWEGLVGARKKYPQSERLRLTQRHPFPSIMDL